MNIKAHYSPREKSHKHTVNMLTMLAVCLLGFVACDKYTPPSPLDGQWKAMHLERNGVAETELPESEPHIWRYLNVQYTINEVNFTDHGIVSFEKDSIIFTSSIHKEDDGTTWPFFGGPSHHPLCVKYTKRFNRYTLIQGDLKLFFERR